MNSIEAASDATIESAREWATNGVGIEDIPRIFAMANGESRREMAAQLVRARERQTADQNRGPPLYRQVEEVTNDGEPWHVVVSDEAVPIEDTPQFGLAQAIDQEQSRMDDQGPMLSNLLLSQPMADYEVLAANESGCFITHPPRDPIQSFHMHQTLTSGNPSPPPITVSRGRQYDSILDGSNRLGASRAAKKFEVQTTQHLGPSPWPDVGSVSTNGLKVLQGSRHDTFALGTSASSLSRGGILPMAAFDSPSGGRAMTDTSSMSSFGSGLLPVSSFNSPSSSRAMTDASPSSSRAMVDD